VGDWIEDTRAGTTIAYAHRVKFGQCELCVHRHIDFAATQWLLSCHRLGISRVPLEHKGIEDAKAEATRYVLDFLREHTAALRTVPLARRMPRCRK